MPGVTPPLDFDGKTPPLLADIYRKLAGAGQLAYGKSQQTTSQVLDPNQNTTVVMGQLDQVVTIGAGWVGGPPLVPQTGVLVGTNLTGQGIAYATGFAHTTITITALTTGPFTLASATGFVSGYVIGAIDGSGNSGTLPIGDGNPAIAPGTTYTISGSAVTLSQPALLIGSGFYCCTCLWTPANGTVHP